MEVFLWYVIIFLVTFLVLYIWQYVIKKKKQELGLAKSFMFITRRYNLNMNKKRVSILSKLIVLVNTFIISVPVLIVLVTDIDYVLMMIIAFFICVVLILIMYNLIGYILKKKGW